MSIKRHLTATNALVVAAVAGMTVLAAWAGPQRTGETEKTEPTVKDGLLIDDFSASAEKKPAGARWELVAPRAANTQSPAGMQVVKHEERTCLHVTGAVPTSKQGSSLQVRRSLMQARRKPLDAYAYDGVQLTVKGNSAPCAIHLRTRDSRHPGQYYQAPFQMSGQWQKVKVPFRTFKSVSLSKPLDKAALVSLAVVADTKKSNADLYIDEISFYRERGENMYRTLTPEEERVILHKGTERPFTGRYNDHYDKGVYTCRRCGAELFESSSKFKSHCGWPSFDEQIAGAVKWQPDADGRRTEIICNNCGGHLGHVFLGERYTEKDTRYCVNSISMDFIPADQRKPKAEPKTERALFASGCFWGTEYHFQRAAGVISTTVGYTGGKVDNPTYKQVCTGKTGHAETTEVVYDPSKITYEQLARLFFETHDFTQLNRQGPDIGPQYRSAVFYLNDEQKQTAERLVQQLRQKGFDVKTEITPAAKFWPAEDYHQDYYNHNGKTPYCHIYRKIF